jgi:hypothetical protein
VFTVKETIVKKTFIVLAMTGTALVLGLAPANAQIPSKIQNIIEGILDSPKTIVNPSKPSYPDGALTRAMNLARQAAERANGGLNNYRAEKSMYGPAIDAPYKDNGNGTLTFTFLGGRPAAPPSMKSMVTVSLDGSVVTVDNNDGFQSSL